MYKKRIVSLILTLCLVLSSLTAFAGEDVDVVDYSAYNQALEFAVMLGIYTDEQREMPGEKIRREEFAGIIANILNPEANNQESWFAEVLGPDNNDTVIDIDSEKQVIFNDVLENNEYFDDINLVYSYDLMNGTGNQMFSPDEYVTLPQVLTVFMKMLGYNKYLQGSYYTAQVSGAAELGLIKGLEKISYTDPMTYADLVVCFENLYDAKICKVDFSDGKFIYVSEENFLAYYFDIEWERGKLWQTDKLSLLKQKGCDAVIGEESYIIPDNMEYLNEYLGREIKAYYREQDSDKELFYARLTERDESITISSDDIEYYDSNVLYYHTEGRLRSKSAKIDISANVLYNGYLTDIYDAELFDFNKGYVTLIKSVSSDRYDTVMVNDFRDFKVVENNLSEGKIYREIDGRPVENAEVEVIDYGSNDYNIIIKDTEGNYLTSDKILKDDIINVARNGDVILILKSDEVISKAKIKSMFTEDGDTIITTGEAEYILRSDYISKFVAIKPNNTYDLRLDAFGYVVFAGGFVSGSKSSEAMVREGKIAETDDGERSYLLKLIGMDAKVHRLFTAQKVKITDDKGEVSICKSPSEIAVIMDGYTSFITYTLDKEGKIKSIEMARTVIDKNGEDVIYDLRAIEGSKDSTFSVDTWEQFFTGGSSRFYSRDKFTTYLFCPEDVDESRYSSSNLIADVLTRSTYYFGFFGRQEGTRMAEYVVAYKRLASSGTVSKYYFREMAYLVTKVGQAWVNDEVVDMIQTIKLNVNGNPSQKTFYSRNNDNVNSEGVECSYFDACPDIIETKGVDYKVEKGDVIVVNASSFDNGIVSAVYMAYKNNAMSPEATAGSKPGWIVGAQAQYDSNVKNGNPYAIDTALASNGKRIDIWGLRVLYGYVISCKDNVLKFTTQDVAAKGYTGPEDGYVDECMPFKNNSQFATYVIDYTERIPTVKKASESDVKTFESYGSKASQILYFAYNQISGVVLIMNR